MTDVVLLAIAINVMAISWNIGYVRDQLKRIADALERREQE